MTNNTIQSEERFQDHKLVIPTCINAIDLYQGLEFQYACTKTFCICGFPGSGKTWFMMYCILYENSKGLKVTITYMMCKLSLPLGGIHPHRRFKIPTKDNLTPHGRAELEILNLMNNPKKIDF